MGNAGLGSYLSLNYWPIHTPGGGGDEQGQRPVGDDSRAFSGRGIAGGRGRIDSLKVSTIPLTNLHADGLGHLLNGLGDRWDYQFPSGWAAAGSSSSGKGLVPTTNTCVVVPGGDPVNGYYVKANSRFRGYGDANLPKVGGVVVAHGSQNVALVRSTEGATWTNAVNATAQNDDFGVVAAKRCTRLNLQATDAEIRLAVAVNVAARTALSCHVMWPKSRHGSSVAAVPISLILCDTDTGAEYVEQVIAYPGPDVWVRPWFDIPEDTPVNLSLKVKASGGPTYVVVDGIQSEAGAGPSAFRDHGNVVAAGDLRCPIRWGDVWAGSTLNIWTPGPLPLFDQSQAVLAYLAVAGPLRLYTSVASGTISAEWLRRWPLTGSKGALSYDITSWNGIDWHMLTMVHAGEAFELWVDGVKVGSYTDADGADYSTVTELRIGYGGSGNRWGGPISDVMLVPWAANGEMIAAWFNNAHENYPPCAPPYMLATGLSFPRRAVKVRGSNFRRRGLPCVSVPGSGWDQAAAVCSFDLETV